MLVAGAGQAAAALLVDRPLLAGRGIDVPPTDPTAWRGVAVATTATAAAGLFGQAAGC